MEVEEGQFHLALLSGAYSSENATKRRVWKETTDSRFSVATLFSAVTGRTTNPISLILTLSLKDYSSPVDPCVSMVWLF